MNQKRRILECELDVRLPFQGICPIPKRILIEKGRRKCTFALELVLQYHLNGILPSRRTYSERICSRYPSVWLRAGETFLVNISKRRKSFTSWMTCQHTFDSPHKHEVFKCERNQHVVCCLE
jgi:hypothetical protein